MDALFGGELSFDVNNARNAAEVTAAQTEGTDVESKEGHVRREA